MKKFIYSIFLFNYLTVNSQQRVFARITMDDSLNLQITQSASTLKNNDTLISNQYVSVEKEIAKKIKSGNLALFALKSEQQIDSLKYKINPFSKKNNNFYEVDSDYFYTDIQYLFLSKKTFYSQKKIFDLSFTIPKYKIIFPDIEDLKQQYIAAPPIIAGNFTHLNILDFNVFYLQKDAFYENKIKLVSEDINKSYNLFSNYFGNLSKPKIIFFPFAAKSFSQTRENVILYNSTLYSSNVESKKIIAHEVAHIWFGNTFNFDNNRMTEGVAEFLALLYLERSLNVTEFNKYLTEKFFDSEGFNNIGQIFKNSIGGRNDQRIKYSLIPLVLYFRHKNNPTFINILSNFYSLNKLKERATVESFENFLVANGEEKLFTKEKLPNFFIDENANNNNINIISTSSRKYNLEIEKILKNDKIIYETLHFKKGKYKNRINVKKVKKITLDPKFKILQGTKLDDIWINDNKDLFYKNNYKYFDLTSNSNEIPIQIINFLKENGRDTIISKFTNNEIVRKKILDLKSKLNSKDLSFTGAASKLIENNTIVFFISYYNNSNKDFDTLIFYATLNKNSDKINSLIINDTDKN